MRGPCDFCNEESDKLYRRILMRPVVDDRIIKVEAGSRSICDKCLPNYPVFKSRDVVEKYRKMRLESMN